MPELSRDRKPVLAIDIGGTKIIVAIVAGSGQVMAEERCLTQADEGAQAVINRLFSTIDHLIDTNDIGLARLDSISIAAAGAIDSGKGVVTLSPNLPGWRDFPLENIVQGRYQINTFLLNDASAAALGEHRFGAGRGVSNLILLTLGTGIGGGIILNGELYLGPCGSAAEIGHMVIDVNGPKCGCGNRGCLETLASGTAIARDAVESIRQGGKSSLVEMVAGNLGDITSEKVSVAAQNGDALAREVISGAATFLGIGMANLVNIFNPEMIVIGGGMAKLGDILLEPARQVVMERAFPVSAQAVRIVTAQLGDEAGVSGAAVFALEQGVRRPE